MVKKHTRKENLEAIRYDISSILRTNKQPRPNLSESIRIRNRHTSVNR